MYELAGTVGELIFDGVSDDEKKKFRFFFSIINAENLHWHLVEIDMDNKRFIYLDSIKHNA